LDQESLTDHWYWVKGHFTVGVTLAVLFSAPHAFDFMLGTGPPDASLLETISQSQRNHST